MRRKLLPMTLIVQLLLLLIACGRPVTAGKPDVSGRRIRIVATTTMITDMIRTIGGERVEVEGMMGPGIDPHLYKASEGDVLRLAAADLVVYNGLHLEAKLADVFERMGGRVSTVAVAGGIDPALLLRPAEYEGAYDPHIWFDVSLWMQAVERARDALIELDPGSADLYRANATGYLAELEALDRYIRERVAAVPAEQRVLVTAHDAFGYFGRRYGFEVRGLLGISTATEAGTADVQALSSFIAQRRIPAIFVESSVPLRTIEAVQAAVRAKGFAVRIGGELFSDALGEPGTPAGSYIGMVRYNIDTIVSALKP